MCSPSESEAHLNVIRTRARGTRQAEEEASQQAY